MKLHLRKIGKSKKNKTIIRSSTNDKVSAETNNKKESYKDELLKVNLQEEKYDKLFEQKLAAQYKEFRNIKEYKLQSIKFIRILIILATIMILALLLISYS